MPERMRQRRGRDVVPAVPLGHIVEIKSALMLQPGPAALTDRLNAITAALAGRVISLCAQSPIPANGDADFTYGVRLEERRDGAPSQRET